MSDWAERAALDAMQRAEPEMGNTAFHRRLYRQIVRALRDARAMGPEWQRDGTIPNHEGFWWGKWRIKAEGTSDPEDTPGNEWEVMHVVENTLDVDDDEHLMVMVPGVEKWQPLENFVWGPKALPAAPKES